MEFITTGNRIAVENFSIGKVYTIVWTTGNYKSLACVGKGSDFVMFQDQAPDLLFCLTMDTAIIVESIEEGGGGSGTMNYNELENKPQINGIVLIGNKTGAELGLASQSDLDDYATNASVVAGLATKQDALSSSQLSAVNSGITSALVTQIGTNTSAIAGKQDALSSSQLAAVNSGITSADVAQITTNKNNILTVAEHSNTNIALANTLNNSYGGVPCTQDANDLNLITLIGTNTSGITMYIWGDNASPVNKYITEQHIIAPAVSSTGVNFMVNYTNSGETITQNIGANNVIPADSTINYIYVQQTSPNRSINFSVKLMVSPKSIYDISSDYIPYTPSNADLYAMIKALQA